MSALDVFLIIILAAVFILAIVKIHKDRKNGKGCLSCGGSCAGCAHGAVCKEHSLYEADCINKTASVRNKGGIS